MRFINSRLDGYTLIRQLILNNWCIDELIQTKLIIYVSKEVLDKIIWRGF